MGRITVRHRGGGHKRKLRELDYEREGKVVIERIEYDPNRTGYIGECGGYGGKKVRMIVGGEIDDRGIERKELIGRELEVKRIKDVRVGGEVYAVGIREGERGKIGRAAGVKCIVIKQGEERTTIRLPSKEVKEVKNTNVCIKGRVYADRETKRGNAGTNRRLGIRPTVKGVAMNPIDHPNGGETAGGGQPKTP